MKNEHSILLNIQAKDISFINKVFEGYDGLALVTTLERDKELILINVTPDTKEDVINILANFPKPIKLLS